MLVSKMGEHGTEQALGDPRTTAIATDSPRSPSLLACKIPHCFFSQLHFSKDIEPANHLHSAVAENTKQTFSFLQYFEKQKKETFKICGSYEASVSK